MASSEARVLLVSVDAAAELQPAILRRDSVSSTASSEFFPSPGGSGETPGGSPHASPTRREDLGAGPALSDPHLGVEGSSDGRTRRRVAARALFRDGELLLPVGGGISHVHMQGGESHPTGDLRPSPSSAALHGVGSPRGSWEVIDFRKGVTNLPEGGVDGGGRPYVKKSDSMPRDYGKQPARVVKYRRSLSGPHTLATVPADAALLKGIKVDKGRGKGDAAAAPVGTTFVEGLATRLANIRVTGP